MQAPRVLAEKAVRLRVSICLFDKRVDLNKTKETCAHILIQHERSFNLVF